MEQVWDIMGTHLYLMHKFFDVKIHSFVLMSNHFHLLVSTPKANISAAMAIFMKETSSCLTQAGNRINETFAGRHYKTLIKNYHYFTHAYKYIYRNPVASGLCDSVEIYPYSTLHGLLGLSHLIIPVENDLILFENVEKTLSWLNTPPPPDFSQAVSCAIRKKEFRLRKDMNTKKPHALEVEMY